MYNPLTEELFFGAIGHGGFCNEQRIFCSEETQLTNSIFVMEFGSDRTPAKTASILETTQKLLELKPRAIRSKGYIYMCVCVYININIKMNT